MTTPSPKRPISGATLVLGLATGSLSLAAVILGSRLVNIERTARTQDLEAAAIERAGSAGRLAAEPLFARDGLRALLRTLPSAWPPGRAPSPTLLAALASASDEAAKSDRFLETAGAIRCVGFIDHAAFAISSDGTLARRGGPSLRTGLRDIARCVIEHDHAAIVARDGSVEVWNLEATPSRRSAWSSGVAEAWSIALAPQARLVAISSRLRDVGVWSLEGALRRRERLPVGTLDAVAFSPDARRLALGGGDGAVRVLSVTDPPLSQEDRTLIGHASGVTSLVWRRDGERLISGARDRLAIIWNPSPGELVARCEGGRGAVHAVAVSEDGARIATAGAEGVVRVHDGASGALLLTLPASTASLNAVVFGGAGRWIAAAGSDGIARRWATDTGAPLDARTLSRSPVWHLSASVTAPTILAGDEGGAASWWDLEADAATAVARPHHDGVSVIAVSPTGEVFTGSDGGDIYRWSASNGHVLAFLEGHEDRVSALAVSADGERVVSASHDGGARVWSSEGRYLHALRGHVGWVTALALSPDGRFAVTGGNDGTLRRWSLRDGASAGLSQGDSASITALGYTLDGASIVAGDSRGRARILDAVSLATRRAAAEGGAEVSAISFSRNGLGVIVGDLAGRARLFDLASGRAIATLRERGAGVTRVETSRDGRSILVADLGGVADIWNATSLRHTARLVGARGPIRAAFSPDGSLVATASEDGSTRLHLSQSGDLIATWRSSLAPLRALQFSPDGALIVAGEEGPARVYPATPDALRARACALLGDDPARGLLAACATTSTVTARAP